MKKVTKMLPPKVHTANSLLDRISNIFYDVDKYISSNPDWVYYFFNPYEGNIELTNYIVKNANNWKDNITFSIDGISGSCVNITINIDDGSEEGINLKRYIYLSIFEENINRNKKIYEGKYKEIKINNLNEDINRLKEILKEKENELKTLEDGTLY